MGMWERLCQVFLGLAVVGGALTLLATPKEDFRKAEAAFQFQDYKTAARLFESLLYPKPKITQRELLIKAHEELGACYFWLKDFKRMEEEFTALLVLEPKHKLDPFYYPPPLIERFEGLRKRLLRLGIIRLEQPKKAVERPKKKPQWCTKVLIKETKRDFLPCLFPFGIGQFSNGDKAKGIAFAVTQAVALGVNIGAFWGIVGLARPDGTYSPSHARTARALKYVQYGALGVFVASAIWGIVDAIVHFQGVKKERKVQRIPCSR